MKDHLRKTKHMEFRKDFCILPDWVIPDSKSHVSVLASWGCLSILVFDLLMVFYFCSLNSSAGTQLREITKWPGKKFRLSQTFLTQPHKSINLSLLNYLTSSWRGQCIQSVTFSFPIVHRWYPYDLKILPQDAFGPRWTWW